MKIYLDTCIVIYFVERHAVYSPQIESLMKNLSHADFFHSPLTKMETLVMPFRTKDTQLQKLYDFFFSSQTSLVIKDEIYEHAAQLRADFPSLKTPDALHLATALHHNCDELWTNDDRLSKIAPNLAKRIL